MENDPQYPKDPEETNKSRKDCRSIIHGHNWEMWKFIKNIIACWRLSKLTLANATSYKEWINKDQG